MFNITEIQPATKTLLNGKASGLEIITNEVLKIAVKKNSKTFLKCFNKCMQESHFPHV